MTDTESAPERPIRLSWPAAAPGSMAPETTVPGVALVTLDRPKALNALSFDLLRELADTLERLDADEACRAIGRAAVIVPGGPNKVVTVLTRLLPRRLLLAATAQHQKSR